MELWNILPGAIVGLLSALVPAYFSYRALMRRLNNEAPSRDAEAKKILVEAQATLARTMKEQVDGFIRLLRELEGNIDELEIKVKEQDLKIQRQAKDLGIQKSRITKLSGVVRGLYQGALLLVAQLEKQGDEPVWRPDKSADDMISSIRNGD